LPAGVHSRLELAEHLPDLLALRASPGLVLGRGAFGRETPFLGFAFATQSGLLLALRTPPICSRPASSSSRAWACSPQGRSSTRAAWRSSGSICSGKINSQPPSTAADADAGEPVFCGCSDSPVL